MTLNSNDIITRRLGRELEQVSSVALGEGIPRLVQPYLSDGTASVLFAGNGERIETVDVAVVEAVEVSDKGDLALPPSFFVGNLQAARWIVATLHTHEDGEPKLVRSCRYPVSRPECVGLIITELGVIEINSVGLVLKEIAPGVATDDVKMKTQASLHVADDIQLMEL